MEYETRPSHGKNIGPGTAPDTVHYINDFHIVGHIAPGMAVVMHDAVIT
jgi:hypothetical protein